ncbi:MAG: carboxy terminal-processing peptidase [Pseudohongiellaceae bacterium]
MMKNLSHAEQRQVKQSGLWAIITLPRQLALLLLVCLLAATAYAQDDEPDRLNLVLDIEALYSPIDSQPIHGETAISLLERLQVGYTPIEIDDAFSSLVFDRYLDALDGSHMYFLQEDINLLNTLRYGLDDSLKAGIVDPGFHIYNLYHRRSLERLIYAIKRIENHIPEMDFTLDESVDVDREEAPYVTTIEELHELWRLRVKGDVLNLKLAGDSDEEINEKLSERYRNRLRQELETNARDVFQRFLSAVAGAVDPHTSYFSPWEAENFNMNLSLKLHGIGAQLSREDDYTKVVSLIAGGPAERGEELTVGDRIVGVGQGSVGEIQDVVGMRLDDVVAQIRGEKDTEVRLEVIPADNPNESNTRIISIIRDIIKLEDQAASKEIIEFSYNDEDYRIGVIDLPTFYFDFQAAAAGNPDATSATRDVRKLLEELKTENVDGVIMDLRNNGGGSLDETNRMLGLFIETGPTVQVRQSGRRNFRITALGDSNPEVVYSGPLAVLVNRSSASSSEIFAGAIQDYQRGVVLGGQTYGKGTVQELIGMEHGQIKLTRSKFYRISGGSTQLRGVMPDILLPDIYEAYDNIGESSLDGALPWDTINPLAHNTYLPIPSLLPELKSRHEERVEDSPDINYLLGQIERAKQQQEKTVFSLNEATVEAEREAERRAEFDADNVRRSLKGLPLRDWEEENAEEDEADELTTATVADDTDQAEAEPTATDDTEMSQNAADTTPSTATATADTSDTSAIAANTSEVEAEPTAVDVATVNGDPEYTEGEDENEDDEEDEEPDPLLMETGHILADLIALTSQQISRLEQ